jgi:structural maintenance of chromosome 3 (chondroitin sulfate proteoglycan 6)
LRSYYEVFSECQQLEAALVTIHLDETKANLDDIEVRRKEAVKNAEVFHKEVIDVGSVLSDHKEKLKAHLADLDGKKRRLLVINEERGELLTKKSQLEFEISEQTDKMKEDVEESKKERIEKNALEKEKMMIEKDIQFIENQLSEALNEERVNKAKVEQLEHQIKLMFSKQARGKKFTSKTARNQWIDNELNGIRKDIEKNNKEIVFIEEDREILKKRIVELAASRREKEEGSRNATRQQVEVTPLHEKARLKREEAVSERKELWRREADILAALEELKEENAKNERIAQGRLGRAQALGIATVKGLVGSKKVNGVVYGPLIELIDVKEEDAVVMGVIGGQRF